MYVTSPLNELEYKSLLSPEITKSMLQCLPIVASFFPQLLDTCTLSLEKHNKLHLYFRVKYTYLQMLNPQLQKSKYAYSVLLSA